MPVFLKILLFFLRKHYNFAKRGLNVMLSTHESINRSVESCRQRCVRAVLQVLCDPRICSRKRTYGPPGSDGYHKTCACNDTRSTSRKGVSGRRRIVLGVMHPEEEFASRRQPRSRCYSSESMAPRRRQRAQYEVSMPLGFLQSSSS